MVKPYSRPAADEPAWWCIISSDQIFLTDDNDLPFGCLQDATSTPTVSVGPKCLFAPLLPPPDRAASPG